MSLEYINLTLNAAAGMRTALLEGREHYVVPMVMMTEGIHEGSEGPLFYSAKELANAVPSWNYKPVVVNHPTSGGASSPEILNRQKIGVVLNAKYDDKQRAEAWIDKERVGQVDARVATAIHNRQKVEVSTGLYVDRVPAMPGAVYNGKSFAYAAVNHRPDHLAILPDQVGACSISCGCGLFQQNSKGFDMTETPLPVPVYNLAHGRIELGAPVAAPTPLHPIENVMAHPGITEQPIPEYAFNQSKGGYVYNTPNGSVLVGAQPTPFSSNESGIAETPMVDPGYKWKR